LSGNRVIGGLFVLAVLALCIATIPVAANLGLLFLYIEPNPRHMPPDLLGEAVGWSIIGLLTGMAVVVVSESLVWHYRQSLWTMYRGLIVGGIIALVAGTILGVLFALIQMDSVDGQAMTSRPLAALAGATSGSISAIAGIVGGTILRRYVISLYKLPVSQQHSRITFNDEDATGAARSAAERSGHAGEHP
jgi:uncharacterized membrane protein YcjF (UPF0283 family)